MPEKAAGLKRKLDDWLKELNPEMPKPNPAYDPAKETEGLAPAIRAQRKAAGY